MSKKMQERKKRARQQASKDKVVKKRAVTRASAKKQRELARIERKTRIREIPLENPHKKDISIREQLEKNLKILQALEEQYHNVEDAKRDFNAELEAQGHVTLKDKLDAMEKKKNEILNIEQPEE